MTLIKSLLLGSAAGLVAVASAQAADLPTRKGPVAAEYVRICSITVAGAPVVGFVLPGSDTCFKISGYITGQIEGGNVKTQNAIDPGNFRSTESVSEFGAAGRDSFGFTTRYNLTVDAVSNTAYGPLVAHGEYQFNFGTGFDNTGAGGSDGGLNRAYVTWAGLTAGKIDSFFSFTGGGLAWANFFSPDRKGYNQPDVLAYTASFGGGFSATISIESPGPGSVGSNAAGAIVAAGGSDMAIINGARNGQRFPDFVASLDVHQAWGAAHIAGVAHNVRGVDAAAVPGPSAIDDWGYAIDAGVSFNIPSMAGSMVGLTGVWSHEAMWYSGLPDGMWDGTPNDNGLTMIFGDAISNSDGTWSKPDAWSVTGWAAFQINPQVNLGIEGSYGEVTWDNKTAVSTIYDSKAWLIGGVAHYDPVKNLDFEFELLYENVQNSQPSGYVAGLPGSGTTTSWQGNADGFAARFEVTRSF
jgi:Porin subfamily